MASQILFITANRLGDAVLTTGLYAALAEGRLTGDVGAPPEITVAGGALAAPLFAAAPALKRLIILEKRSFARHWLGLWREVVGTRWDLVVDLRDSAVSRLIPARKRLILSGGGKIDGAVRHKVETLAALAGITPPPGPRLWLDGPARQMAVVLSGGTGSGGTDRPILALAPTANWLGKEWPADRFIALAHRLVVGDGPLAGAKVMVVAAPGERERAQIVLNAFPPDDRIDVIGRGDAMTAAAALSRAALFVGNDSGLMHIASAVGVPTLGLFGPGLPEIYGPWGENSAVVCSTVSGALLRQRVIDEGDPRDLMDGISVEAVFTAAAALLRRRRVAAGKA